MLLFNLVNGAILLGSIIENSVIPDLSLLYPQTQVVIDEGNYSTFLIDGTFSFDLPPGTYKLDVISPQYYFAPIRIEVSDKIDAFQLNPATDWTNKGAKLSVPLEIVGIGEYDYFTAREQFSIMSLFSNPMVLLMAFSFIMFLTIPKLKEQIDPEAMQQYEDSKKNQPQVEMPDISANLANWFIPQEPQEQPQTLDKSSPTKERKKKKKQ